MKRSTLWLFVALVSEFDYGIAGGAASMSSGNDKGGAIATNYPAQCDSPLTVSVDPEKCCNFPRIFADIVMTTCENDTKIGNESVADDLVADSCTIECMFNRSLNAKLSREGMMTMVLNNSQSYEEGGAWNKSLITKAIDTCFDELTDADMAEIAERIRVEMGVNPKSIATAKMCHPKSFLILDCVYRELFKVCPIEKFLNDLPECKTLRNYTSTCDDW